MVNFNGTLVDSDFQISNSNRSFLFGDGVFETMKVVNGKILFFEDHYFRLMASMRIVRMEIPMSFTLEYLENQIMILVNELNLNNSARVRFTVYRNEGGFYSPQTNSISFVIQATDLESKAYFIKDKKFEVDLYKDNHIPKQLLSTLKTTSKITQVVASVFAKENEFDSCIMLNDEKNVIETISGNIFMLTNYRLITPPISDGCLNGIMRKQIIQLLKLFPEIEFKEESISPFDLQKADELFITNVIAGIQPISKYRKKDFGSVFSERLLEKLNQSISIN
ncbi:aminotransferase class IV [Flavobacterium capsici]|uniref:branched-chain-amino-acid transaminase n=1 Tax=Flavobacterium capsici TaxID=3075618 RepID=A0AA96J862_9FLAO|nr:MULTISPECIES: aminotransferase class IV [unclassified Flavobacterium]WNM19019.1 aminotransferase class IV [Flavobacterium sp. PMR2A8]WNM23069.1 aminotransferase class IV [Flavobacterium sp. PMTSA4]